jgi:AcrR family transcriptional regulator
MLLCFFGSKERLIADALAHIRTRERLDFKRAVSKSRSADRIELLLRDWRLSASPRREKYSRFSFEVYGLALQNPRQFPGFLKRAVGDWLPLFEQAFAAAGVPPRSHEPWLLSRWARCAAFIWTCSLPANESVLRRLFGKC